ncbi:MAG: hypothetical protein IJ387_06850, partial [Thermoguttaceae bacterium]|nr:hypothetical protein [Thermoguttaceae bacterium]
MKKMEKFWTAAVAFAALTAINFVAEPTLCFAQISFGKMRDASEKGKKPPVPVVDEDEDADEVEDRYDPDNDPYKNWGKPDSERTPTVAASTPETA